MHYLDTIRRLRRPEASAPNSFRADEESRPALSDYEARHNGKVLLVTSHAQLQEAIADLLSAEVIGIDTETTGLNPFTDRLRLIQFSIPGQVLIVDCFVVEPCALTEVITKAPRLVGHNLAFDLRFLMAAGLPMPEGRQLFDTMIAAQVLHAGTEKGQIKKCSLATLVAELLAISLDKSQRATDWLGPLSPAQIEYIATDAAVLLPLAERLGTRLEDARLMRTMRIEMDALLAIVAMEKAGLPINQRAWIGLSDRAAEEQIPLLGSLHEMAGKEVNWQSQRQVLAVLRERGHKVDRTKESVLKSLAADDPLVDSLLQYRDASKRVSTWGKTFLNHVHPMTGRIHAGFIQIGAASGRMACQKPNLQNIPRDSAYRCCISAPEGRLLIKADFSQIELRIVAQISGDTAMLDAFRRGDDLHISTAATLLGVGLARVTPEGRQLAKALNFGLIYGMGATVLRSYAHNKYGVRLTESDAERHRDSFFKAYPRLRRWQQSHPDGQVETRTLAGRRRLAVESYTHKLNTPVQGTGVDILKSAMGRLQNDRHSYPSASLVLVVHDEIVIEADTGEAERAAEWLKGHMIAAAAEFLDIPVKVDIKIGKNWGGGS